MDIQLDGVTDVFDEDKVNNGVWVHLVSITPDDETGDDVLLYLDPETKLQPQQALVRSNRCTVITQLEEKAQGDGWVKIQKAPKKNKAEASKHMLTTPEQRFPLQLVAFNNVSKTKPGRQDVSTSDAKTIFHHRAYASFVSQIQAAAADDELYKLGASEAAVVAAPQAPGSETVKAAD